MKKFYTLALAAAVTLTAAAAQPVVSKTAKELKTERTEAKAQKRAEKKIRSRAGSEVFPAYYVAPAGVFYNSLDVDADQPYNEYAFAPCGVDIVFHTEIDPGYSDYEWTYYNQAGRETEAENEDIIMNFSEPDIWEAPLLYSYRDRDSYAMARDGILFGQGYDIYRGYETYAGNLNTAWISGELYDAATLAVNYEDAGENFAEVYPLKISNVAINGWGELFRYGGAPYAMEALRFCLIYTGSTAGDNEMEADIYTIDNSGSIPALGTKLATYPCVDITRYDYYQGSYWYTLDFAPENIEEAPVITSDVMVVFRPAEGTTDIISPSYTGTFGLPDEEPTTSFVIADYTRNGEDNKNGCLEYASSYRDSRGYQYCKHWNASAKLNWDVKTTAIGSVVTEKPAQAKNNAVYNLKGVKVSDNGINGDLPAGIYITDGKKVLVK